MGIFHFKHIELRVCKQVCLALLLCFTSQVTHGQIVGDSLLIVSKSGEVIRGKVLEISDKSLKLETEQGFVSQIDRDAIDYSKALNPDNQKSTESSLQESIAIDDYHANRYFLSPSGYTIPKGSSYYENIGVFFNSFGFGLSANFSLAVGAEIISTLYGNPIIYVSPRFHVAGEKDYAWSIGGTFLTSPSDNFVGVGVLQTAF